MTRRIVLDHDPGALGVGMNAADVRSSLVMVLEAICDNCGTEMPPDIANRKHSVGNDHLCTACDYPLAHSLRRNDLFAKRRKDTGGAAP